MDQKQINGLHEPSWMLGTVPVQKHSCIDLKQLHVLLVDSPHKDKDQSKYTFPGRYSPPGTVVLQNVCMEYDGKIITGF